jgi:hypothetical protein
MTAARKARWCGICGKTMPRCRRWMAVRKASYGPDTGQVQQVTPKADGFS